MSRKSSKHDPASGRARLAARYVRTASRAQAMGIVDEEPLKKPFEYDDVVSTAEKVARAGIGRQIALSLRAAESEPDWAADLLDRLDEAMGESPSPETEWPRLEALFGADELGRLVNVSPASVRRYREGERQTPDAVAARLHVLALIAGDLLGTYNEVGVRRWFQRARTRLGGRRPADLLRGDWAPEDPDVQRVRDLARALVTFSAT